MCHITVAPMVWLTDRITAIFDRLRRGEISESEAARLLVELRNREDRFADVLTSTLMVLGLCGLLAAAWCGAHR